MNYQQALDYLYSFINYEKSGMPAANPAAYNLERIAYLLELLGNPQANYPSIMIAGTKGRVQRRYCALRLCKRQATGWGCIANRTCTLTASRSGWMAR